MRKGWTIMKLALLTMAALAVFAGQGSAQSSAASPVQNARQACRDDAQKLCPGKRGPEARDCLLNAGDKVKQACRDALAKLPPPKS